MPDQTEGHLRRELDLVLGRLEQHERIAQNDAHAEGARLVGDMFADAQVVASRNLDALSYERLSRRARALTNALERVRDGSYGLCEECGSTIPQARRRALPGVTTCVRSRSSVAGTMRLATPARSVRAAVTSDSEAPDRSASVRTR